jgi:hypothetical protein
MRQVVAVALFALVASLVFAPVASAQTKWVRGTVVSSIGDTVVVTVTGKDMTFKVDKTTELMARGAGRAQREAEMKGAEGVKLSDFVKPGVGVEVQYKDVDGVLKATAIHSGVTVREGATSEEVTGGSARGAVTAVSNNSISVKGADKEWTFVIDSKTSVVGTGLGTINRQFKAEGKSPTATDLVGAGDQVIVYFKEAGGVTRANEIRVMTKAAK